MYKIFQGVAALAGFCAYFGYFFHGEHHLQGLKYLQAHTVTFLGLTAILYRLDYTLVDAVYQSWILDCCFLGGLFTTLVVYRAFLNPLNAFPGPWLARITSFDMTFRIRKGQMYQALYDLHRKHGYFVRIGTSEVSITHPHAVREIFGSESVCEKSPWYDISRPQDSLLLRRTDTGHAELRSIWSHAFSIRAMKGYEERIVEYRRKLIDCLDAQDGRPININHWLGLFSWDVLSDLSFGHPFGMLDGGDKHWAMNILKNGMAIIGPHLPMWWLRLLGALPGTQADLKTMFKYCTGEMLSRWESEPKRQDVMSHLFVPYRNKTKPWDATAVNLLAGEAHLLINAGSDTTRVAMACSLFILTKQPELANRLREAIAPHISEDMEDAITDEQVSNLDLLNGVIQEALRLWPPSPSHPTRVTPPGGTTIAGQFIAGGTQLITPQYVIGRDENVFPRATEFIPERWYSMPDLVKDKEAIAPFSLGPWGCIGKPLAMTNVRLTIATLVMRYDLSFGPSPANPVTAFEEGMHEHFSLQPGPLELVLEKAQVKTVENVD